MHKEKLNFGIILRIIISLFPILLGMPTVAMVFCAYNITMSFLVFGPLTSFVSSLCAVCISMFMCGIYGGGAMLQGMFLALESVLCAAGCIYAITVKKDFYSGVWLAAAGSLIPGIINMHRTAAASGMSIAGYLTEPIKEIRPEIELMLESLQQPLDNAMIDEMLEWINNFVSMMIPSIVIIINIVIGYIVMWAVTAQLRKLPLGIKHSFSHIKVPKLTVSVSILSLAVYGLNFNTTAAYVALNVFVILMAICYFAGVSLLDFYMRRLIKNRFVRLIFHFMISGNAFPVYILAAAVDAFANFRKLPVDNEMRGVTVETEERND